MDEVIRRKLSTPSHNLEQFCEVCTLNSPLGLSLLRLGDVKLLYPFRFFASDELLDFVKHAQTECALVFEIASRFKFCVFDNFSSKASIYACPGFSVFREWLNRHSLGRCRGRKSGDGEADELIGVWMVIAKRDSSLLVPRPEG